jgi:hypothetical protein
MREKHVIVGLAIALVAISIATILQMRTNDSPIIAESLEPTPVPFTELTRGATSAIATSTNYLITSESQLEKLWQLVDAEGDVPKVDFNTQYVAAVFAGQRPTTGYAIEVSKVEDTTVRTVVVTLAKPGSDCVTGQSVTAPYAIIVLPKTPLTFTHQNEATTTLCSQ